jgi:membrane-bound lytic murein transglycosylase B
MPSAVLDFAVDFDGDRVPDICGEDPTDALASVANYLKKHGWKTGQPWGFEVRLPEGFDYGLAGTDQTLPSSDWAAMDVLTADGGGLPDYGPGSIFLPAGARGLAFMVLRNFHVITRYNKSEIYALAIGHLSDRLLGSKSLAGRWPRDDRVLSRDDIAEVQLLLTRAGFDTQGIDGMRGPNTLAAARQFQAARGMVPDGYLNEALLTRLRELAADQGG